jgi:phosphoglycolate phosphatase-like HAD superfamily hydrolase
VNIDEKEYINLVITRETNVILERLRGMDIEAKKDSAELSRRLEELNHAHANAERDRGKYVEKAVYDDWRDGVNNTLAEMKGRWAVISAISALIASMVVVIARTWFLH